MRFAVLAILLLMQTKPAKAQRTVSASVARNAAATIPFESRIDIARQGEVEQIKKLNERVKAGDRSLCVHYHDADMSGCTKVLVGSFRAHSAVGIRALLDLPVTAALKDRALGVSDKRGGLLLVDDLITIIEGVHPETFFAKMMSATSKRDRLAKSQARGQENKLLENFRLQALPDIDSHLAKTQQMSASLDPQLAAWENSKSTELSGRLARLKSKRWIIR